MHTHKHVLKHTHTWAVNGYVITIFCPGALELALAHAQVHSRQRPVTFDAEISANSLIPGSLIIRNPATANGCQNFHFSLDTHQHTNTLAHTPTTECDVAPARCTSFSTSTPERGRPGRSKGSFDLPGIWRPHDVTTPSGRPTRAHNFPAFARAC